DQPQPTPALLLLVTAPEQERDRRQQARQGETQERRQADRVGHTRRQGRGPQQAEDPGLLHEVIHRHQGNRRAGQGQAAVGRTEQEHAPPGRLHLSIGHRRVEGRHLNDPQRYQRHQPDDPHTDQQVALRAPQQPGTHQAVEQHEQGGQ
ncbi:hypothetical protein QP65_00200, partial [Staphylococcus aureus]